MTDAVKKLMQDANDNNVVATFSKFIMCGGCKATGVQHTWSSEGDLVPHPGGRACRWCHGTGMAKNEK